MKVSVFRPDRIEEINFSLGRHQVTPHGELRVPHRDELLLLHYKYLGIEQTHARQQALFARLGSKDVDPALERQWGHQYGWSVGELAEHWRFLASRVVDVHAVSDTEYPLPRWWFPMMETVNVGLTPPRDALPDSKSGRTAKTQSVELAGTFVSTGSAGRDRSSEPAISAGAPARFLDLAGAIRYSHFEIEAAVNFFEFRGNDLYLHPPNAGASRLRSHDIAAEVAGAAFTCTLSLDDRSAGPVIFGIRLSDAAQAISREAVVQPGERREIELLLDGFDGPLSAEFTTEMQAGAPSNHFAWATFHEPRLTYRPTGVNPSRAGSMPVPPS